MSGVAWLRLPLETASRRSIGPVSREIRGRRLGPRFRRQVPMDPYVVDFYCSEAKLIVEVDGEFHGERQKEDARRTVCLEGRGYRVIRFQAIEILMNLDSVLERLLNEIPPSGPWRGHLPREGGGAFEA